MRNPLKNVLNPIPRQLHASLCGCRTFTNTRDAIYRPLRSLSSSHRRDATRRDPTRHDGDEGKGRKRGGIDAEKCSEQNMPALGLGSNYYSRSLNARVVLNMARAALIREREFRRARAPACIPGQKPESGAANGPPDTGGQKCAQKIAANLNC